MNNIDSTWNSFVSSSRWGDILQFSQWGEVKRLEGWSPHYVTSKDTKVRSIVLIKKAGFLGNLMYVPHGPVFQSTNDLAEEIDSWKEALLLLAREQNCFLIEIDPKIGHLVDKKQEIDNVDESTKLKHKIINKNIEGLGHFFDEEIIDIFMKAGFEKTNRNMQPVFKLLYSLELSEDELMSLMDKNTRYNIRYAQKKGVQIHEYLPDDPEINEKLKVFYGLMKETQKRTGGYPIRPYDSFLKLFDSFKGTNNLALIEASFEGDVIAMNISQRTQNWASSFYAGSNRLHPNLKAPYLLRWHSVCKAKEFGSKVYDFWGIIPNSKQHEGYSSNKLSFGGARIDHVGIMEIQISAFKAQIFGYLLGLRKLVYNFKRKIL